MNLYALLVAGLLWGLSVGGSYLYGVDMGIDRKTAEQAREDEVRRQTREDAQQGAAEAIGKLEIKHVTIRQQLEREVREKTVFAACRSGPDSVRLFNAGIPGHQHSAEPAGGGQLPAADAPR